MYMKGNDLNKKWIVDRVNESFNFYYGVLGKDEKIIYEKFCYAYLNLSDSVLVDSTDIKSIGRIFKMTLIDNPVFFYVNTITYYCYSDYTDCHITYLDSIDAINESINVIDKALKGLSKECEGRSDLEKEVIIHNTIVGQVDYQLDDTHLIHKSNSIFLNQKAVCDGISLGAKMLLDHVGVKTIVVKDHFGKEREGESGHAWNMVFVNKGFYHIDFTFDNNLSKPRKNVSYDYFNLTDKQISRDHDISCMFLKSSDKIADYHSMKGLTFKNQSELFRHIESCINKNTPNIYFRCIYKLLDEINVDIIKRLIRKSGYSGKYIIHLNDEQGVYDIVLD